MTQNIKSGKLAVYITLLAAITFSSSCIKDYRDGETNLSGTQPVGLIAEGGLSANAFGAAALTYPGTDLADTPTFHVNYAADNVAPAQEQFTLGIDQNALKNYNASGGLQYVIMPDSDYSFKTTSVSVAKGGNYTPVPVVFYPSKIDPSKNYMLPISITAAPSGTTISSNQGTIYYHAIGNPIAGTYEEYWSRWSGQSDTSGGESTAAYYKDDLGAVVFAPQDPTSIEVASGGTGDGDIITFTNTNGVLSDFNVSFDAASITTAGITITSGPFLQVADPVHGYYRIYFTYLNASGLPRAIINEFIKQ